MLNLLTRLTADLGLPAIHWRPPIRKAVTSARVAADVASIVRSRDVGCLLVLRDEDDGCPKITGPELAGWLADGRQGVGPRTDPDRRVGPRRTFNGIPS